MFRKPFVLCLIAILALLFLLIPNLSNAILLHKYEGMYDLYHLAIMMNHGLILVLDGSSMEMLAEMKMAPGIDRISRMEAKRLFKDGKNLVKRSLSGDEMLGLHEKDIKNDPRMKKTHELGEAMLKIINILENMDLRDIDRTMELHHMHIMLNHSLKKASEGANLMMLGDMDVAAGAAEFASDSGRKILGKARELLAEIADSSAMKKMHRAGMTPEKSTQMHATHEFIEYALKIMDIQENMVRGWPQ